MSEFTIEHLADNVRIGDKIRPWWDPTGKFTGSLFAGSVPEEEVRAILDWTPEEVPVYTRCESQDAADAAELFTILAAVQSGEMTGETVQALVKALGFEEVPNRKAIKGRRGTVLHIPTGDADNRRRGYVAHPYYETLVEKGLGRLVAEADSPLYYGTVGCLGDGKYGWVQVRPPEGMTSRSGMDLLPWIGGMSTLTGQMSTTFAQMTTTMVCDNTFRAGVNEAARRAVEANRRAKSGQAAEDTATGVLKIRHTAGSVDLLRNIGDALGLMWESTLDLSEELDLYADVTVSDEQFTGTLDLLAPVTPEMSKVSTTKAEKKRAEITSLYRRDIRVAPWNGTALGVLQAFNTWHQHNQTVRNVSRDHRRILNTMGGEYSKVDGAVIAAVGRATRATVLTPETSAEADRAGRLIKAYATGA